MLTKSNPVWQRENVLRRHVARHTDQPLARDLSRESGNIACSDVFSGRSRAFLYLADTPEDAPRHEQEGAAMHKTTTLQATATADALQAYQRPGDYIHITITVPTAMAEELRRRAAERLMTRSCFVRVKLAEWVRHATK